FVRGTGGLALGVALQSDRLSPVRSDVDQRTPQYDSEPLPQAVAGIPLVDSAIAKAAVELSRNESPRYLFNHAVRTYLFGSLIGKAEALKLDAELLYLACILHDLGLTARHEG